MLSDEEIIKQFYGETSDGTGHKGISESGLRNQKDEDELNRSFFVGDRSAYTHEMSYENTKFAICFNRVRPYIHSFAGFAAQNRRTPEYFAVEKDDQKRVVYTETANKTLSWIRSTGNADQIETEQDKELAICGYAAVVATEDYMRNPDGEITFTECTRDFWWDPSACQAALSDRRWEFIKKKIHIKEALKRFGGKEEDYEAAKTSVFGRYEYWPAGGSYDKIAYDWIGTQESGMVYIYEYHWYDLEPYWRIKNPLYDDKYQTDGRAQILLTALDRMKQLRLEEEQSEDLFTFDPRAKVLALTREQFADVKAIFASLGIECDYDENLRKVFCEAVLSGNRVFQKRKAVDQSGFAVKVKTADYDYQNKIWAGMVSSLREPAKYANKSVTEFLLILAATAKPGVYYNLNMIPNVPKFEKDVARNAKALAINGDPNMAVRDKQQAALSNGYDTLYPMFLKSLSDVIGFAPEAMGLGDVSQPSFELEEQRIKQVMTTLAVYFDAITLYQKEHARSMLYFMRRLARNNEGRHIPMLDENGERGVAEVYSSMLGDEYSVDIGEMPDTPTKRKEQSAVMANFADKVAMVAPQKAPEVYALAVEYLPIAAADKAKWRKVLMPEPTPEAQAAAQKQQQMQEAAATTALQKQAAEIMLKQAQAKKTEAETQKVETETDQKNLENIAMTTSPPANVSITI